MSGRIVGDDGLTCGFSQCFCFAEVSTGHPHLCLPVILSLTAVGRGDPTLHYNPFGVSKIIPTNSNMQQKKRVGFTLFSFYVIISEMISETTSTPVFDCARIASIINTTDKIGTGSTPSAISTEYASPQVNHSFEIVAIV